MDSKSGCKCDCSQYPKDRILSIKWRRLTDQGRTCPRCQATEVELEKAMDWLIKTLSPLGIRVVLEKQGISIEDFKKDPLQSNLILINDKPIEHYLNASTGQSQCCDICGPSQCRTIQANGQSFETIPSDLIKKAAMIAASAMLASGSSWQCLS